MKREYWVAMLPFYLLVVIVFIGIAKGSSDTVTVISESMPPEREYVIVIDAGHGGVDGGATSCTGVLESQINLEIARKLNDLLILLGMDTVMVRTTDTSIYTEGNTIAAQKVSDLKERVKIVNNTENAILISIHQNTFSDSRYHGAQVFYASTEGSRDLAHKIQTAFTSTINTGSNRKSKPAKGVYLLEQIERPGVLIECGFLSNPEEESRLRNEQYQKLLCCVIASSISCHFYP